MNRTSNIRASRKNKGFVTLLVSVVIITLVVVVGYMAFSGPSSGKTSGLASKGALNAVRGLGAGAADAAALALNAGRAPYLLSPQGLREAGGLAGRNTDVSLFDDMAKQSIQASAKAGNTNILAETRIGVLGENATDNRGIYFLLPHVRGDLCTSLGITIDATSFASPTALVLQAEDLTTTMNFSNFNTTLPSGETTFGNAAMINFAGRVFATTPEFCLRTADNAFVYAYRIWTP